MRKPVLVVFILLSGFLTLLFQNCSGNKFVETVETPGQPSTLDLGIDNSETGDVSKNQEPSCNGGIYSWKVGNNTCQGGFDSLKNQNGFQVVNDTQNPTLGKVAIACVNGKVSIIATEQKTCINAPVNSVTTGRPLLEKPILNFSDRYARIYLGVTQSSLTSIRYLIYCIHAKSSATNLCETGGPGIYRNLTSHQNYYPIGHRSISGELVFEWDMVKTMTTAQFGSANYPLSNFGDYDIYIRMTRTGGSDPFGKFSVSYILPEIDVQTLITKTYSMPFNNGYKLDVTLWCRDLLNTTVFPQNSTSYGNGFGPENQERQCAFRAVQVMDPDYVPPGSGGE